jgi:hypothetical protein
VEGEKGEFLNERIGAKYFSPVLRNIFRPYCEIFFARIKKCFSPVLRNIFRPEKKYFSPGNEMFSGQELNKK